MSFCFFQSLITGSCGWESGQQGRFPRPTGKEKLPTRSQQKKLSSVPDKSSLKVAFWRERNYQNIVERPNCKAITATPTFGQWPSTSLGPSASILKGRGWKIMGEERLHHLHSQVVRRVDKDIKIISNKNQQNKQIFSIPLFLFFFMWLLATLLQYKHGF